MEETHYILSIQAMRHQKNIKITLSQASYIDKILAKFSMAKSKKDFLSFKHGIKLSKQQSPNNEQKAKYMKRIPYASLEGSLMYAMHYMRVDISCAIGVVSHY